jgi:2-C-methyl-D-erythritol 4-phosphate cytidylyltransferase
MLTGRRHVDGNKRSLLYRSAGLVSGSGAIPVKFPMSSVLNKVFGLIPAAGSGVRSGAAGPKQFMLLRGQPVLAHALRALLSDPRVERAYVVLAPDDQRFAALDWGEFGARLMPLYCGGASRCASVANGLAVISGHASPNDWVMVHDAARPCVPAADIRSLIGTLEGHPVGGLLATPVADSLKQADQDGLHVLRSVDRQGVWQALTPQMFRAGILDRALKAALGAGLEPGDEAAAVEALGANIRLVRGSRGNMKITYPEDFDLAARLLGPA